MITVLRDLTVGQVVFWRWRGSKTAFTEGVVQDKNGDLVAIGRYKYGLITGWLHQDEIELIIKDASEGGEK